MLDIIATGHYYADLHEEQPPRALRDELRQLCPERFRRIDRFTELCLLGSARCMSNSPEALGDDAGIYIGSGFAGIANTAEVHRQVFGEGMIPKPAGFIHTLGNSAGYYVARNFGVQGQNLFVSRGTGSLVAVLQIAAQDIQLGAVKQALVGVVDECDRRLDFHRRRQGLPENEPLAEGSHWFLLSAAGSRGQAPSHRFVAFDTLAGSDNLQHWLHQHRDRFTHVYLAGDASHSIPDFGTQLAGTTSYQPGLSSYPSRTAGVLMTWLEQDSGPGLLTVNGDASGRYHLCLIEGVTSC